LENANQAVQLVACNTCFEIALFGTEVKEEKPYNALLRIRTEEVARNRVKELFDALLDVSKPVPQGCRRWKTIAELN
jgi:putative ATP-dependent endonuclease of OLD family